MTRDDVLRRANPLLTENKQLYLTTIYRSFFGGFEFFHLSPFGTSNQQFCFVVVVVDVVGDLSFLTPFIADGVETAEPSHPISSLTVVVVGPHCS